MSWKLYQSLEAETGQPIGQHITGSIRLAKSRDKMKEFQRLEAKSAFLGIETALVGPAEIKKLWPLMVVDGVVGGLHIPGEGYIDPSMTTNANARGARDRAAEIYRGTKVVGLVRTSGGEWDVITDKGTITAEIVVNAAGI